MRVIARNSSVAARQRTGDLREIARILDVRFLLEGSVRRAGSQLRITAQLIARDLAFSGRVEDAVREA